MNLLDKKVNTNYNKKTKKASTLFSYLLFLISPFFALPVIIHNIYTRKTGGLFLFSCFLGLATYLLLPDWTLDLARYYEYYEVLGAFSFKEFNEFLGLRPDYVYYIIFYIFAKIGFKFQVLLWCMTAFNYYIIFKFYDAISGNFKLTNKTYFSYFVLLFLSIAVLYYISATRYVLGCSFFVLFLNNFFYQNKKRIAIFFLVISILIHISFLILVPIFIALSYYKNRTVIFNLALVIAIISILFPMSIIVDVISIVVPGLGYKIGVYMAEEREANIIPLSAYYMIIFLGVLFLFYTYRFLPIRFFKIFMITFLGVLLTVPFGYLVFDRYMVLFMPIFVIVLFIAIESKGYLKISKLKVLKNILYFPLLLNFIFACYFYRFNFVAYFNLENLFLVNILKQTYTLRDFI